MRNCRDCTIWLGCLLLIGMAPLGFAQEPAKGLDSKAIDQHVYTTLREVINHGADLYNEPNNDWAGCHRLYEGALLTLKPFLAHRAELQGKIDSAIDQARKTARVSRRAFVLRELIDEIRTAIKGENGGGTPPKATTMWERLGGEKNVRKVVDDFVAAAATSKEVNFFRDGKYKLDAAGVTRLKQLLVEMISANTGGPYKKYTGKSMLEAHKGMGITNKEYDATVALLVKALKDNGAKDEDIAALGKVVNSLRDQIVEEKQPDPPKKDTLWERLGGEAGVTKVVDDFVQRAATDKDLNFFRDGKFALDAQGVTKLKKHLVDMISAVSDGPREYKGREMKEAHKGMAITEQEFNKTAAHLAAALKAAKVPDKTAGELLTLVASTKDQIVEKKTTPPVPPKDSVPKPKDDTKPKDAPPPPKDDSKPKDAAPPPKKDAAPPKDG